MKFLNQKFQLTMFLKLKFVLLAFFLLIRKCFVTQINVFNEIKAFRINDGAYAGQIKKI